MGRNRKGQFVKGTGLKDLSGKRFGKLKVIELDRIVKGHSYWIVECECGKRKSIRGDTLKTVTSCGCIKKHQDIINLGIKNNHKMTHHPVYNTWHHMIDRCKNPKAKFYKDYGGRGIKVCKEWRDIKAFAKWADENGYAKGLTIERKDVNGNYCPENCCWITAKEQAKNKRNTIYIIYENKEVSLQDKAKELGVSIDTVRSRWYRGIRDNERLFYHGDLRDLRRLKRK